MNHEPIRSDRPPRALPLAVSLALHAALGLFLLSIPVAPADDRRPSIELTDRQLPAPPEPKAKPPAPKPPAPEPPKEATLQKEKTEPRAVKHERAHKRAHKRAKRPAPPPPPGKPESETEPDVDTGAKRFGIEMEGTAKAPPGHGVEVPEGGSPSGDPSARRVGKGKPTGKRRGFKKKYEPGEAAPVAVVTSRPGVKKRVQAVYPPRMRELEIEGRVVLQLTIDGKGKVVAVKVLKSLRKPLDQAAIKAARQMLFSPAKVGSTPVKVKIPYTFTFVLD